MMGLLYRVADALRRRARRNGGSAAAGKLGEDLAHRFLQRHGCKVVARNYRPPAGGVELDLVAWHGERLAIVEVKARASVEYGAPDRAIGEEKREHVKRAAQDFARRAGVEWPIVRFDVISILLGSPPHIDWQQDAFR